MASRGSAEPAIRVLLVEDSDLDAGLLRALSRHSRAPRYRFIRARTLAEALRRLRDDAVDVVLADLELPDACGLDAVETLVPFADATPIVVVTANDDPHVLERSLRGGVQDLLVKGSFDGPALDRSIRHAMLRQRRIRRLERTARAARFEAAHDALTGLPNRHCFVEQLEESISYARRYGRRLGLLFVDVDHFKRINDRRGHAAGDAALGEVARRLRAALRSSDLAARLGGDEFAILVKDIGRADDAAVVARNVLQALRRPWLLDGSEEPLSASVGVALFPEDAKRPDRLLRAADTAMYVAKSEGRDRFEFFRSDRECAPALPADLDREIVAAVDAERLTLAFQPTIDTKDGEAVAAEALLRWRHPIHGELRPHEILPAAEAAGCLDAVEGWVLDRACRVATARHWPRISINLSAARLRQACFVDELARRLDRHRTSPRALELELHESDLMLAGDRLIETIGEIRALGVRVALDDVGTREDSLRNLRRIPCDAVKIGPAFAAALGESAPGGQRAATILAVARSLGLDVIATRIESAEQRERLGEHGCRLMQGRLFAEPRALACVDEPALDLLHAL